MWQISIQAGPTDSPAQPYGTLSTNNARTVHIRDRYAVLCTRDEPVSLRHVAFALRPLAFVDFGTRADCKLRPAAPVASCSKLLQTVDGRLQQNPYRRETSAVTLSTLARCRRQRFARTTYGFIWPEPGSSPFHGDISTRVDLPSPAPTYSPAPRISRRFRPAI